MAYVIPEPPRPALPVAGTKDTFPVRRIYCVGRNYAEHAIEMGHDPNREPPFFFQKSPENLLVGGGNFPYPVKSNDVHWELELVLALKTGGTDIPAAKALDYIYGYAVGLDMTRRDLQGEAKKMGRPWDVGKAFDHSAPCGPIHRVEDVGHPAAGRIWLEKNGEIKQDGDLNQMIWKIPEMIEYLSGLFMLAPGDLIMTGTPAGVGAVQRGDVLRGGVDGVDEITIKVV
ncbi:MAG: fumarylacetoacetate hydrolase family protein [Rhodospirillaceae bacterium]